MNWVLTAFVKLPYIYNTNSPISTTQIPHYPISTTQILASTWAPALLNTPLVTNTNFTCYNVKLFTTIKMAKAPSVKDRETRNSARTKKRRLLVPVIFGIMGFLSCYISVKEKLGKGWFCITCIFLY